MGSEMGRFSRCHLGTSLLGYSVEVVQSQRLLQVGDLQIQVLLLRQEAQ